MVEKKAGKKTIARSITDLQRAGRFLKQVEPKVQSSHDHAWADEYATVQLLNDVPAVRVHQAPARRGRWYAIDIGNVPFAAYKNSYAIPRSMRQAETHPCMHQVGTLLNFGVAGPLGRMSGEGLQAEYLRGPAPRIRFGRSRPHEGENPDSDRVRA